MIIDQSCIAYKIVHLVDISIQIDKAISTMQLFLILSLSIPDTRSLYFMNILFLFLFTDVDTHNNPDWHAEQRKYLKIFLLQNLHDSF